MASLDYFCLKRVRWEIFEVVLKLGMSQSGVFCPWSDPSHWVSADTESRSDTCIFVLECMFGAHLKYDKVHY